MPLIIYIQSTVSTLTSYNLSPTLYNLGMYKHADAAVLERERERELRPES